MEIPSNFRMVITEMLDDFTKTFPEHSHLWHRWTTVGLESMSKEGQESELMYIYEYITPILTEIFMDVVNQNDDIFLVSNTTNTFFLPEVDFKMLFNCHDISTQTKEIMWNYLKLLAITVVIKFGDVDETELMGKLNEIIENMKLKSKDNIPLEYDDVMKNFQTMFEGKVGSIAKDLAEEFSVDFKGILGEDLHTSQNPQDLIKKLLSDPSKMTDIFKNVNDRIKTKIDSGDINQSDLLKEVSSMMGGMGDMSDMKNSPFDFQSGPLGKMFQGFMNMNTKDTPKTLKQLTLRDKLKNRIQQKKR